MKEQPLVTIPWTCPACTSCRLVVSGTAGCSPKGHCVYGGPYKGYVQVLEQDGDSRLQTLV